MWGSEATLFYLLLGLFSCNAVEFPVPFLDEFGEEGVPNSLGIERRVGVVVLTSLAPRKEQHQFGELEVLYFLCKGLGEKQYSV